MPESVAARWDRADRAQADNTTQYDGTDAVTDDPTDEEIAEAASDAAEGLILSRYKQSDVTDMDVTVRFEGGVLDVDVYLNAPDDPDPEAVVEEAIEAAEAAVDELFETSDERLEADDGTDEERR